MQAVQGESTCESFLIYQSAGHAKAARPGGRGKAVRQGRKGLGRSRAKWRLRRYRGPGRDAQNLRRPRRRSDRGPAVVRGGSPPFSSWWRRAFIYALTVEGSRATEMQRPGSRQHSARNQRNFFIQSPLWVWMVSETRYRRSENGTESRRAQSPSGTKGLPVNEAESVAPRRFHRRHHKAHLCPAGYGWTAK